MHAHCLIYLYDLWQEEYGKVGAPMVNFNDILAQVKSSLHELLKTPLPGAQLKTLTDRLKTWVQRKKLKAN